LALPKILKFVEEGLNLLQKTKGNTLGDKLKALREAKGLKLEDIAAITKIALPKLTKIESNKLVPSLDVITKLAKQYGVDVNTLIGKK